MKWSNSKACKSRAHCRNCLIGNMGDGFYEQYDMPEDGYCPHGVTLDDLPVKKREDGRKDYTGCQSCKEKMLKKMKD